MDLNDIFLVVLSTLFGLVASILGYVFKRQNKTEDEMNALREFVHSEISELKDNYLSRFDEMKKNNNEQFTELKLIMQKIQDNQAKQTEFCNYIQRQKE